MQDREKEILEYARASGDGQKSMLIDVLIATLFMGAVVAGLMTFAETRHRPMSKAFEQYQVARVVAQATRPSYVPAAYVGRRFDDVSPWGFASCYIAIGLFVVGGVALGLRRRG
jgi:hypothetical protein